VAKKTLSPITDGRRRYAKVADAATYLDVNQATIRTMLADGRLTAYRLGPRVLRVDLNEVDAAMAAGSVA
jgi:excisionase family DNA binding protein